jgi:arsenite-transporting ATPase
MTPVLKAISSVVGSDALSGVASFLRAIDGMETEFSRRALAVATTLRGDDTHFVVVTAPSPDALTEARHFISELSRLKIQLRLIVTNRMPPRFGHESSSHHMAIAETSTGDDATLHAVMASLLEDAERAEQDVAAFVTAAHVSFAGVPVASATELPEDIHSMQSIEVLAQQLAASETQQ